MIGEPFVIFATDGDENVEATPVLFVTTSRYA